MGARGRAALEIGLVVSTSTAHFVLENFYDAKAPFMVGAGLFWVGYLVWRLKTTPGLAGDWGFRRDTFRPAMIASFFVGMLSISGMVCYGYFEGHYPPPWSFWVILPAYPIWGLIQQFLLCSILARNLNALLPAPVVVPVAAVLFGAAHLPDWPLAGLTCAAALPWTSIYLWRPNLYALGLWHGVLGTFAYYVVLGRDALEMTVGG